MRIRLVVAALLGIVIIVLVFGYTILSQGSPEIAPANSHTEVTSAMFQPILDTLPGGAAQLAMLSYNFQLNGNESTLFVVFKNYSNSSTAIASILFDQGAVANSSMTATNCNDMRHLGECDVTLYFGAGSLKTPLDNSSHMLRIVLASGAQFDFSVTAGEMEEAGCTFTSSC